MAIKEETSLDQIAHLDFPAEIRCEYGDCENTATHKALCSKCPAFEFFCRFHVDRLLSSNPDNSGTFDRSCGHVVRNGDVRFIPIFG